MLEIALNEACAREPLVKVHRRWNAKALREDFANYTVVPEIALAKVREDAPFANICYIGCGVTTGIGAVFVHG